MRALTRTLAVVALAIGLTSVAHAQNGVAVFSWVPPTQYTDNTPIPAGDLTGYVITATRCAGTAPNYTMGTSTMGTTTVSGGTLTTYTKSDLTIDGAGQVHCFTMHAVSATHGISAESAVVYKAIVAPGTTPPVTSATAKPAVPSSFSVK